MVMVKIWAAEDILHVRLNRPEKANAYNDEMLAELREIFRGEASRGARAIALSGEGKNFCAGADLRWIHESAARGMTAARAAGAMIFAMYESLLQADLPILGEIHGNVFGGGLGLVAACDRAAADPAAVFCLSEVRLGMIPGIIAPLVSRKLGEARYQPLAASGSPFDAQSGLRWGLVHAVTSERESQARTWAKDIRNNKQWEMEEQRRAQSTELARRREELIAATCDRWVSREATLRREAFLGP